MWRRTHTRIHTGGERDNFRGEKKTRKKDERDGREGDAEFRFSPAVVPVRSTEEGVNAPRGGMDDTAGGG